jgi:hypothetical protein
MTNPLTTRENRFQVDTSIIRHLIFSQAGTLHKALLELVMNSLDAQCEKVLVDISEDMRSIVVSDDGVGFKTIDDIEKLFGTFGFDHQTEEELSRGRNYGRFGLGRAQCLAFGSTVWTSNQFTMTVDLKGNSSSDLPYIIQEHADIKHKGCKIELSLYDAMSVYDKRELLSVLRRMAKYVQTEVVVDGCRVNEDISSVKWSASNEDFLFLNANSQRGLSIYNKGVLVCTYSHSKFGVSGDITSIDKNFAVNMARNDVLITECELFKRIGGFIKPFAEKKTKKIFTDEDRKYWLAKLFSGQCVHADVSSKRLCQNADGKYATLRSMYQHANGILIAAPDRLLQNKGMLAHRRQEAFCLSASFLDMHGFNSLEDFVSDLNNALDSYHPFSKKFKAASFDDTVRNANDASVRLGEGELSKIDKVRLTAVQSMYSMLLEEMLEVEQSGNFDFRRHLSDVNEQSRVVCLGRSETSNGWTDGVNYIAINVDYMRDLFDRGYNGIIKLMGLLVHEQCHDSETMSSHFHSAEFYEKFHNVMRNINTFTIASKCIEKYLRECKKINRRLSDREMRKTFDTYEKLVGLAN